MCKVYTSLVSLLFKLKTLNNCRKLIKNWHLYPMCYFGLKKSDYLRFETKSNVNINLRTNSTDLMAFTHVWLLGEYSKPGFEINENDVVVDIGAHIGLFALLASQFCKRGRIFCYEPVPENFDLMLKNIRENNINNITAFNLAVSQNEQRVKIFLNTDQSGHSMFLPSNNFLQANSTTLKKIFDENNIDRCNFLKLDCEGAEYEIIQSLPDSYFNKIEKMIIEYHFADSKPTLLKNLIKKLESLSYRVDTRQLFTDIGFLYAKK